MYSELKRADTQRFQLNAYHGRYHVRRCSVHAATLCMRARWTIQSHENAMKKNTAARCMRVTMYV